MAAAAQGRKEATEAEQCWAGWLEKMQRREVEGVGVPLAQWRSGRQVAEKHAR